MVDKLTLAQACGEEARSKIHSWNSCEGHGNATMRRNGYLHERCLKTGMPIPSYSIQCLFTGRGAHFFIMKSVFVTALALLQTIELSSASPESLLYPPSHRSLHARRLEVSRDSDSTRVLSALQAREDYTCGPGRPCGNKACCGESGNCGYGATYCGKGCTSNCGAVAECGKDSKDGKTTCPLNTCCSQYGFCGTTKET